MVIVLAFAFVLSATLTIYVLFRSGDTRVPSLAGKPEAEAQKIAERAGLRVKIQRRSDSTVPGGSVIETRPAPNSSVKKDSSLTIVVSSGPLQTKSENRNGLSSETWPLLNSSGVSFFCTPVSKSDYRSGADRRLEPRAYD